MADDADGAAERTRAALAYVCTHVEEIREDLLDTGDAVPLDRVTAALHTDGDVSGPLDVLHARLQADGDAAGVYGSSRSVRLAGTSAAGAGHTVYLCPTARCSRWWWPQDTAPLPRCGIVGQSLRRTRL
ncbi:hypothetical protein ACIRBY_15630 [Streptomyces sp. NPDC096136]|uniref:hypothetical protein n=1 Tax=Streptomyces sp. NPDC096136 TaxID=3366076 RepID=UPI0038027EFC